MITCLTSSMATLKQLYDLVHSLDKTEKKNVSILIKATAGKAKERYLKSFDLLNNAKVFDADKIKLKLEKLVSGMNLSEANTNLYNYICKCILFHYENNSSNLGLLKELLLADLFISKRLISNAEDIIDSVVEKASSKPIYNALHSAYTAKQQLDVLEPKRQLDFDKRVSLLNERIEILNENIKYLQYRKTAILFFELVQKFGDPRNKAQENYFIQLLQNPVFNNIDLSSRSMTIRLEHFELKCMILSACNKIELAYNTCTLAIENNSAKLIAEKRFDSLQNLLLSKLTFSINLVDNEKINESREQLLAILPFLTNKNKVAVSSEKILYSKLFQSINAEKYEEGIIIFEQHLNNELNQDWQHSPLAYIDYLMAARLCFLQGDIDKTLDYLQVLQEKEKVMRPSFLISYKFLYLLCHYKLNNFTHLSYATASLYKMLSKTKRNYAPEKALLHFLKNVSDHNNIPSEIEKLRVKLLALKQDHFNSPFFTFADYEKWLITESKKSKVIPSF